MLAVFSTPLAIFNRHRQLFLNLSQHHPCDPLKLLCSPDLHLSILLLVSYNPHLRTTWIFFRFDLLIISVDLYFSYIFLLFIYILFNLFIIFKLLLHRLILYYMLFICDYCYFFLRKNIFQISFYILFIIG